MVSLVILKRLFAESFNICAFPGCGANIIDLQSGIVIGEICHIKARKSGGPRYDPSQTPAERDAYGNLILLCSVHHKVVDNDTETYSVESLTQMKEAHRSCALKASPIDDIALSKPQY